MSELRTINFQKNKFLEKLMNEINSNLSPSENLLISQYNQTKIIKYPLIFIMGPLRSGTTLFTQWLANTGLVAYPTNLLSRFYHAPIIGSKIQLLLTDPRYNFRNELGEFNQQQDYKSENGKTQGALAPNEFWYFWRRFLAEPDRDVWTDVELKKSMDTQTLIAEIAGIMDVFQKPFAAKGMLFNYNIPFFDSVLDKVLFVQIKRDPVANVASILEARKRQLGDEAKWYSFKIPEYEKLKDLDAVSQSAGQLHYINNAVDKGMAEIEEPRKIVVPYEDFCLNPDKYFHEIISRIGLTDVSYNGEKQFSVADKVQPELRKKIEKAMGLFSGI